MPSRIVPLIDAQGQFTDLDITFNQDYMCWVTQGDIARRHLEKLGESDRVSSSSARCSWSRSTWCAPVRSRP